MKGILRCSALLLLLCGGAKAQEAGKPMFPPVDEVVDRVQRNIEKIGDSLPDFLCDERITSQEFSKSKVKREVTVESVVRAVRTKREGAMDDFAESREVKSVNGKPAANQDFEKVGLPYTLKGGFSGALGGIFGAEYRRCFDFSLAAAEKLRDNTVLVLSATAKDNLQDLGGKCKTRPGFGARYWLDPETMQVLHAEPLKPIHRKDSKNLAKDLEGFGWPEDIVFSWSVDFSKISIDGKPYWMPVVVGAQFVSAQKPRKLVYTAKYGNYHKFSTSIRVLVDGVVIAK